MIQLDKTKSHFYVGDNISNEIQKTLDIIDEKLSHINFGEITNVHFVGGGSSNATGMTGAYYFNKYTKVFAFNYSAQSFINSLPNNLNEKSLIIGISQSGTTKEVLKAVELAKGKNAQTLALTFTNDNLLAKQTDYVLDYYAEAMWSCQLVAILKLIESKFNPVENFKDLTKDLTKIPTIYNNILNSFEKTAIDYAKHSENWKMFYTISTGSTAPLGYKEGVITGMEFLWANVSFIDSADFPHGPLELVDEKANFLIIQNNDSTRETTQKVIDFVERYHGNYLLFDANNFMNNLHFDLAPIVMFLPLEMFMFHYAAYHDHNPDDRRYYGVVTY